MQAGPYIAAVTLAFSLSISSAETPRFRVDDPLWTMPQPLPVTTAKLRKISDVYDVFYNELAKPGEEHLPKTAPIAAQGVNTLGEVPDGEWYVNRHYYKRMSIAELEKGPAGRSSEQAGEVDCRSCEE